MSGAIGAAGLDLVRELARALGLPRNTRRATITLEAGQLPKIELEAWIPRESIDWRPVDLDAIRRLRYVIRLEPSKFDEGPGDAV